MSTANLLAISTAPATIIIGKPYYDLSGTIALMRQLFQKDLVDGLEFQNLAEWDATSPPQADAERYLGAWHDSPKYTTGEIGVRLNESSLPILSIHANRDIGVCLCSSKKQDINRGRRLIHESMSLAEQVGAPICVFHMWDTLSQSFDLDFLIDTVTEICPQYHSVKMAIENVPTHLLGFTPFALAKEFEWVTLDLKWAAMYDELEKFATIKEQIVNIHLRGNLEVGRWVLPNAPFHFYDALNAIRNDWRYTGLITMEPGSMHQAQFRDFELAMASLR